MTGHKYLSGTIGRGVFYDLLVEKKITQAELANKVGVSTSTMICYVSGSSQIPH